MSNGGWRKALAFPLAAILSVVFSVGATAADPNGGADRTDNGASANASNTQYSNSGGGSHYEPPAWIAACINNISVITAEEAIQYLAYPSGSFTRKSYIGTQGPGAGAPPDEEWIWMSCDHPDSFNSNNHHYGALNAPGLPPVPVSVSLWRLGDPPPPGIQQALIDQARSNLEVPIQKGSAAPDGQVVPLVTQDETWLWVDPSVWAGPAPATASVPGLSVTANATALSVEFFNNDGDSIPCGPNSGTVYQTGYIAAGVTTDCSLTFLESTALGDKTLSSTITWEITYVCSAFCGAGTLEPVIITNTRDVLVAEIQALESAGD